MHYKNLNIQIIIPLITSEKSTFCTQLISYLKYTFAAINSR
jgi:hypothetical protein